MIKSGREAEYLKIQEDYYRQLLGPERARDVAAWKAASKQALDNRPRKQPGDASGAGSMTTLFAPEALKQASQGASDSSVLKALAWDTMSLLEPSGMAGSVTKHLDLMTQAKDPQKPGGFLETFGKAYLDTLQAPVNPVGQVYEKVVELYYGAKRKCF